MPAGTKDRIYVTNTGTAALCRTARADFEFEGNVNGAGATNGMRIYNRRSSKRLGIQPRRIVLRKLLRAGVPDDGIPDQFAYRYVTILTAAAWTAYVLEDEAEYDGEGGWVIDRKQPETSN